MSLKILVDMSATIIHHGHIRLLKKAKNIAGENGQVIVGLSLDDEIIKRKGYTPELNFEERKEIMEAIKYVDMVIPSPWMINEDYLNKYNIDILVHGDDNVNDIPPEKIKIFPRTKGVSSSELRNRVLNSILQININKKTKESTDLLAKTMIEFIANKFKLD